MQINKKIFIKKYYEINPVFEIIILGNKNYSSFSFFEEKNKIKILFSDANYEIIFSNHKLQKLFYDKLKNFLDELNSKINKSLKSYTDEKDKYSNYEEVYFKNKKEVMSFFDILSTHFNVKIPNVICFENKKHMKSKKFNVLSFVVESGFNVPARTNIEKHYIEFFGFPIKRSIAAHEFVHYLLLERNKKVVEHDSYHDKIMEEVMKFIERTF